MPRVSFFHRFYCLLALAELVHVGDGVEPGSQTISSASRANPKAVCRVGVKFCHSDLVVFRQLLVARLICITDPPMPPACCWTDCGRVSGGGLSMRI